jgi:hypothetical protein
VGRQHKSIVSPGFRRVESRELSALRRRRRY